MELNFEKMDGLVPAIIQDAESGKVLMLAYMNEIAWNKTLETGKACFYIISSFGKQVNCSLFKTSFWNTEF